MTTESTPKTHAGETMTDERMESVIGMVLRIGVTLSALVVTFGGIVYLFRHGLSPEDYRNFHGEPADYTKPSAILRSAITFHGRGIIQLGLIILIATPVVRVAFSIWAFLAERDRLYAAFTVFVLAILLYSLVGNPF